MKYQPMHRHVEAIRVPARSQYGGDAHTSLSDFVAWLVEHTSRDCASWTYDSDRRSGSVSEHGPMTDDLYSDSVSFHGGYWLVKDATLGWRELTHRDFTALYDTDQTP